MFFIQQLKKKRSESENPAKIDTLKNGKKSNRFDEIQHFYSKILAQYSSIKI